MIVSSGYAVLESGQSGFAVSSGPGALFCEVPAANTLLEFIAETSDLLVCTGDQWGPFGVTTRLHEAEPWITDDWEDVVEVSVTSTGPVHVGELIAPEPSVELFGAPGSYRVRVAARGRRSDHDWGGSEDTDQPTEPIEHYLIEAWPAAPGAGQVVRLTSEFSRALLEPRVEPELPETGPGLAAAARIGRDVDGGDGARSRSGALGALGAHRQLAGSRRTLFARLQRFQNLSGTPLPSWRYSFTGDEVGDTYDAWSGDNLDRLTGTGAITMTYLEVEPPSRIVRTWNWKVRTGPGWEPDDWQLMLADDGRLTVSLHESKDDEGQPRTEVEVRLDGVPVEWVDDLRVWWELQLARYQQLGLGTR